MILTTLLHFFHPVSLKLLERSFHKGLVHMFLLVSDRAKQPEEFHYLDLCFNK